MNDLFAHFASLGYWSWDASWLLGSIPKLAELDHRGVKLSTRVEPELERDGLKWVWYNYWYFFIFFWLDWDELCFASPVSPLQVQCRSGIQFGFGFKIEVMHWLYE